MNHFGIAFGTIVVGVLVGAVAFDHAIKDKPVAAVASRTPTQAESSPPPEKVVVASSAESAVTPATDETPVKRNTPRPSTRPSAPPSPPAARVTETPAPMSEPLVSPPSVPGDNTPPATTAPATPPADTSPAPTPTPDTTDSTQ